MYRLKELIEESRTWPSIGCEADLFKRVSQVLMTVFDIPTGMFIYRTVNSIESERSKVEIYAPWGFEYSSGKLTLLLCEDEWFSQKEYVCSEQWTDISMVSGLWKSLWTGSNVQQIGSWPLMVQGKVVGALILGKAITSTVVEDEVMAACSTYVSIILEMLLHRRISEYRSRHDYLTHISNRGGFIEQAHELLKEYHSSWVVGLLDINDFKLINDAFGHEEGDRTLIDVANTLKSHLTDRGICGRFGGDEFVLLLQSDSSNINNVTSQVVSWFRDKQYSVSVGCERWDNDVNYVDALKAADQKLYAMKKCVKQNSATATASK